VIEPDSFDRLKEEIEARIESDRGILDELRGEIRPLRDDTRRIQPRAATSISLVATDGERARASTARAEEPLIFQREIACLCPRVDARPSLVFPS